MNDWMIRQAVDGDLPEIMRLEAAGFLPGVREDEGVFARRLSLFPEGFLVSEHPDRLMLTGCITCEIWEYKAVHTAEDFKLGHDISSRHNDLGTELYVSSMTVDPAFRSKGIGSRLFQHCLSTLGRSYSHLKTCVLLVDEEWHHALRIYLATGFVEIAKFDQFFCAEGRPPADGIVMRRKL